MITNGLPCRTVIIRKPADKGASLCVLDSMAYHKDVAMQLKDTDYYTTTSRLLSDYNSFKINRLINWLGNSGHVNHNQADFLLAVCDTK